MQNILKYLKEAITPETEEEILPYVGRNIAQQATRLGEGAVGAIPSGLSLLATGAQKIGEHLAEPGILWPGQEDIKESLGYKGVSKIRDIAEKATPEALRSYTKKISNDYLEPQTSGEEALGNLSTDIGSMVGFGTSVRAATKIAGLGNAAYQGAKLLNSSEETAQKAKMVGMLSSGLFKKGMINPLTEDLYKKAGNAITKGSKAVIPGSKKAIKDVIDKASKGGVLPYKTDVKKFAKSLGDKIKKGKISVDELWQFKKDLNSKLSKGVDANIKAKLLEPVNKIIRKSLDTYGNKNKEFGAALENADKLFSIKEGVPFMDKAVNKLTGTKDSGLSRYFTKGLAWGVYGFKGLIGKKIADSIATSGEAFFRSPEFRKESIKLATSVAKKSMPATINSLRKLEKIKREYPDELKSSTGTRFKILNEEGEGSNAWNRDIQPNGLPKGFKVIN